MASGGIPAYIGKSSSTRNGLLKGPLQGGTVDAWEYDQGAPAPAFPAFRFTARRARIDWRILHGVDVHAIVRDLDLDTLEKVVGIVAHGDIEAEDLTHLTELNFVKIFRLAQLVVEYLLYVQDYLQSTNAWLQHEKSLLEKYASASRQRVRELDAHYRTTKRELRRVRRTAKTYETMAAIGTAPGAPTGAAKQQTGADKIAAKDGAVKTEAPTPAINPMEIVLRQELLMLAERLSKAQAECASLRADREEMSACVRDIDTALKVKGLGLASKPSAGLESELRIAKEQLSRAHADYKMLRVEKEELSNQCEGLQSLAKVLQQEKEALLQEMGRSVPDRVGGGAGDATADAASAATGGVDNKSALSEMLLEAEGRNKVLTQRVEDLQQQIGTLQKQLMKAMKDAAAANKPSVPGAGVPEDIAKSLAAAETARSELSTRCSELEQMLSEKRRAHEEDVKSLQDELFASHQQLGQLRTQLALTGSGGTPKAGFSKTDLGAEGSGDLQSQLSASRQECAALKAQVEELHASNAKLTESLLSRDTALHGAWSLVKDLQAQLAVPVNNRDADSVGRVRARVEEFERVAQAASGALASPVISPAPSPVPYNTTQTTPNTNVTTVAGSPQKSPTTMVGGMVGGEDLNNASFRFANHGGRGGGSGGGGVGDGGARGSGNHDTPAKMLRAAMASAAAAAAAAAAPYATPSPAQASAIKQEIMKRVQGKTPEQIAQMAEDDLRVISEHPYEYQDDDEAQFRSLMPCEVTPGPKGGDRIGGVLAASPHTPQDLAHALHRHGASTLAHVDHLVWSFGVDPSKGALSDREYTAMMTELDSRREAVWGRLDADKRDRAEFLRDALFTHLELVKRRAEHLATAEGPSGQAAVAPRLVDPAQRSFPAPASPPVAGATAAAAAAPKAPAAVVAAASVPQTKVPTQTVTHTTAQTVPVAHTQVPLPDMGTNEHTGHDKAVPTGPVHTDEHDAPVNRALSRAASQHASHDQSLNQSIKRGSAAAAAAVAGAASRDSPLNQSLARSAAHRSPSTQSLNQSLRTGADAGSVEGPAADPLNQSLTRAAAAAAAGGSGSGSGAFNQSLRVSGKLGAAAAAAATAATQPAAAGTAAAANSGGSAGPSRLSGAIGSVPPAAGVPGSNGGVGDGSGGVSGGARDGSVLNQSIRQGGAGNSPDRAGLNQTRRSNEATNRMLGSIRALGGVTSLNASMRSAGTAKASLRDYSAHHDFDDSDSSDAATGHPGGARTAIKNGERGSYDEYSVGEDEEETEQIDIDTDLLSQGLPPPQLTQPAQVSATNSAPPAAAKQPSAPQPKEAPAAKSKVPFWLDDDAASPGEESGGGGGDVGTGEEGETDWDESSAPSNVMVPRPQRVASAAERDAADHAAYAAQRKAAVGASAMAGGGYGGVGSQGVARAQVPQGRSAAVEGWGGGNSAMPDVPPRGFPPHLSEADAAEVASVKSFHPNDTNSSIHTSAAAARAAAANRAWASPDATLRGRGGVAPSAAGGGGGGASDMSRAASVATGRWNETIQTVGSSVAGDELQPLNQSLTKGLAGSAWGGAGARGGPGDATMRSVLGGITVVPRGTSGDDISDVDYF